jgi:two-component system sensor histidine kinase BaeS
VSLVGARRGQPLSVRLALVLAMVVVAVLLVTGLAVNRLVSRGLEDELSTVQRDRVAFLAQQLEEIAPTVGQPRMAGAVRQAMQRIARQAGGRMLLLDAEGRVLLRTGEVRPGVDVERVEEVIPGDAGLRLAIEVPAGGPAFLGVFNLTLLVAGILAVGALVAAAGLLSERLTRPLRGVAVAARRLGAGDLAARASGGPDRESAELADAFNAMAARLQRSEELRRRAASDMAHDLATPATVLESQLQAMLDGVVPTNRVELERARAAAAAMSGVIVQLRELVDVEAAAVQRMTRRVPISELVEEVAAALSPLYRDRDVRLAVQPAPAASVEVDPNQVSRALRNVLTNAAQHSPPGGKVQVDVEERPGEVVVRVADQGSGIAPEDLPHVFERFYRADPARRGDEPHAGSGIGLTIARELLAVNGGGIEVESTGPDGTTFALRLPRVRQVGAG